MVRQFVKLLLIVCLAICLASQRRLAAEPVRSVIILVPSHVTLPWNVAFIGGVRDRLRAVLSDNVAVYTEDLNLQEFPDPSYAETLQIFLREKYRSKDIEAIITISTTTLEFMLRARSTLWSKIPIFAVLNNDNFTRSGLPPDVTGLMHELSLRDMVTTARAIVPSLERIALVGDPLVNDTYRAHFAKELPTYSSELGIIDLTGWPMARLKKRVAALPERTAILYTNMYINNEGATYFPRDALMEIAKVANRPIVVDAETFIGYGAIGGLVADPSRLGEDVANGTLRILGGESASQIPILPNGNRMRPIFDWRQLQRWGISESALPAGSELRFRESSAWEQYRWQIVIIAGVLLVQSLLIVGLLYEHRRRRHAETASRQRMSELAHMNRSSTAGELSASIAHEVKQPLAAITANGSAALRWLANATPDLGQVRAALEHILDAARHAGDVTDTIRALFKKSDGERFALNTNVVIEEILAVLRRDLQGRGVFVETRLRADLSEIVANRVQLQQVILNLVVNAAEAMDFRTDRDRVLRVTSEQQDQSGIQITVEDSGPGMEPKNVELIFAPFYTTKPGGMGMGLAICRSIIEAHGGRLSAAPGSLGGLAMKISLPASAVGGASSTGR